MKIIRFQVNTSEWLLEEMVCHKNVLKTYLYLAEEFVILISGQYSQLDVMFFQGNNNLFKTLSMTKITDGEQICLKIFVIVNEIEGIKRQFVLDKHITNISLVYSFKAFYER